MLQYLNKKVELLGISKEGATGFILGYAGCSHIGGN